MPQNHQRRTCQFISSFIASPRFSAANRQSTGHLTTYRTAPNDNVHKPPALHAIERSEEFGRLRTAQRDFSPQTPAAQVSRDNLSKARSRIVRPSERGALHTPRDNSAVQTHG